MGWDNGDDGDDGDNGDDGDDGDDGEISSVSHNWVMVILRFRPRGARIGTRCPRRRKMYR